MADVPTTPIEVNPSQKLHYETLFPVISALTKYTIPSMPPEEAVGEASRVNVLIKEDRANLDRSGTEPHYLDSFEARAGAMSWSAAQMITCINTESTAKKEWVAMQSEVEKVRKGLLKALTRALRKDKDLSDAVKRIKERKGNLDQVFDFLSMSKLAQENKEKLQAVYADLSLIERSSELYIKLSDIYSRMVIDPKKLDEAKVIYYKAWTYLKEALDEVYEAGRYVFDEDDPRHALYYSDYHVRLGKASAKAKRIQNTAKDVQENDEKDKEMVEAKS